MKETSFLIGKLLEEMTFLGGWLFYLIFCTLIFYVGLKNLAFYSFLAFLLMYIIAFIIRSIYFKNRPNKQKYFGKFSKFDASSFPSLHATRATFILLVLLSVSYLSWGLAIFSLLIYLMVLYSRITLKKHDVYDLIGGIIFGGLLALFVFLLI